MTFARLLDPIRGGAKEGIADDMTEHIVDLLEAIEIHEKKSKSLLRNFGALQCRRELVGE